MKVEDKPSKVEKFDKAQKPTSRKASAHEQKKKKSDR